MKFSVLSAFSRTRQSWDELFSFIRAVQKIPFLNSVVLQDIDLVVGANKTVRHTLGRRPIGWVLIDNTQNAAVWRPEGFSSSTLTLTSSADTRVTVWLF